MMPMPGCAAPCKLQEEIFQLRPVFLAAVQAVELLTRQQDANAREKELMKAVPENDTISAVLSSVKISMPGLSKLKTQQRKSRKG